MRKYFFKSVIVLVCGIFLTGQAAAFEDDFFGYYTIQNSSKDFADINMIHLSGTYGEQQNPKIYGLIRLKKKSAQDFQLLKPVISGKSISFSTKSVNGISYRFAGAFTKTGNFPEMRPEGEIILKGLLQKFKGKIKIAEKNLNFSYAGGD